MKLNVRKIVVIFGAAVLLAGCITSLHPFYTEENLIFDPSLLGTWVVIDPETGREEAEDGMTWTFTQSGEKGYDLIVTEKEFVLGELLGPLMDQFVETITSALTGKQGAPSQPPDASGKKSEPGEPAEFEARLFRIEKSVFMDIIPSGKAAIKNTFYLMHTVPVHTLWRVSIKKREVRLEMLDSKWFEKMIEQKKVTVGYAVSDDRYVLTASTEELQKFLLQYGKNAEAFTLVALLHRRK